MFYSHEILTSRQHGVATVWLVATLGSKSTLKRVTRRAILDVDVPKACETIQDPSAPMALRLQGNLLYGVSRVYSQQCGYVLADTQSFRDKVKGVVVSMNKLEIDPDAGKARPEQLNLPDDPAFLPDFDMNLDLSRFDISTDNASCSDSMTPPSFLSSRSSMVREAVEELALVFPSAETQLGDDLGGLGFGGDTSSAHKTASRADRVSVFEDTGMIEDPGFEFEFDADGNLFEHPTAGQSAFVPPSATDIAAKHGSDSTSNDQVREEHEASLQGAQLDQDTAFNDAPAFALEEDTRLLSGAPPFSPARHVSAIPTDQVTNSSSARPAEVPSSAEAPQRTARAPKVLQADDPQELANADLARWNTNYLVNMAEAAKIKQQHKAVAVAKKNAAFWVAGQGIAGVGLSSRDDRVPNPLAILSGQTFFAAITGREASPAGTKRTRSLSDDLDVGGEARRVRARGEEEQQIGRGNAGDNDTEGLLLGDEGEIMFPGEDMDIEIGRHAPESLHHDHSSQMPWNVSASRRGSARPLGSGLQSSIRSSVGGQGAHMEFGPASAFARRRGSRLTSASPLLGRGGTITRYSSFELPEKPDLMSGEAGDDRFERGGMQLGDDDLVDDPGFQLYSPAAAVDTQTAAQGQWVVGALDTEARNFLAFLRAEIAAKIVGVERAGGQLEGEDAERVTFEGLLPPEHHSKVVASQGLLHVLSLVTKGLIVVRQEEAFAKIEIGVVTVEEEDEAHDEEMED